MLTLLGAAPLAAGTMLAASGSAQAGTDSARPGAPEALLPGGEFDRYLARLAAQDEFSGTVVLRQRKRTLLRRSHGFANLRCSIPNEPDTVFCTASITKLFTQAAIAQLIEQDKVASDGTVGTYLDGFPPEIADVVTVEQLLTHTSGIGRPANQMVEIPGSDEWDGLDEILAGTLDYIRGLPLNFPPGSQYEYSNDGYTVLGGIVDQVCEELSYHDYIRQHVFRPFGMTNSDFYTAAQWGDIRRRLARPHAQDGTGQWVDIGDVSNSYLGTPAGGAFADAQDLVRFVEKTFDDTERHVHGGAPGLSTDLIWFTESSVLAVILSNYDHAAQPVVTKLQELVK
ncbi:serine hydrolase domain-containing protein [Jiangella asiatica]|uniref:serine hydrolase domain-containing protein n=1 Tax=Jiangella asiatica TaxID=2530372 RepID=UPI0013A5C56E|nr:serine hydrolase domain-containing protein [Jiangella asiatica]